MRAEPPKHIGAITVADVASTKTDAEHIAAVKTWAQSSWQACADHHVGIRLWLPKGD